MPNTSLRSISLWFVISKCLNCVCPLIVTYSAPPKSSSGKNEKKVKYTFNRNSNQLDIALSAGDTAAKTKARGTPTILGIGKGSEFPKIKLTTAVLEGY